MNKNLPYKLSVLVVSLLAASTAIAATGTSSFTDPTASLENKKNIHIGSLVYIGPFAKLEAGKGAENAIHIGNESNVQDSVTVDAEHGAVHLGEMVILAHGATVRGHAEIGEAGHCHDDAPVCPSFVSFNAVVDGAIIEKDAMVSAMSRVGHGVTIPSGLKTIPGKNITSNAEVAAKTSPVTAADREFMEGVIHVNTSFAVTYPALEADNKKNVRGINYDPGHSDFNPDRDLPTLHGISTREPGFRNRIIGAVIMHDTLEEIEDVMGKRISLRADEGEPFHVGSITRMDDGVTFHALEHSHVDMGDHGTYGERSIVHGGATDYPVAHGNTTMSGTSFKLGEKAVFFRSRAGNDVTVGARSVVQQSDLPNGTVIPANTIYAADGAVVIPVEWTDED